MIVIKDKPGSGKTKKLIQLSAETGCTIVTANLSTVKFTLRFAEDLGLKIPEPITFSSFFSRRYRGIRIKGFLFDDADSFIQGLTDFTVFAMTARDEDFPIPTPKNELDFRKQYYQSPAPQKND